MLEKQIERDLIRYVKQLDGQCLKFISPNCAGVPDRLVLLPGGRIYFVELKQAGKELSPLQVVWRDRLLELGMQYRIVQGQEGLSAFLKEVGDAIRTASVSAAGD